jgi:hypothetical protein
MPRRDKQGIGMALGKAAEGHQDQILGLAVFELSAREDLEPAGKPALGGARPEGVGSAP